jgi:hypothetical protein
VFLVSFRNQLPKGKIGSWCAASTAAREQERLTLKVGGAIFLMGENSGRAGLDAGFAEALEFGGQKDVPVLLNLEVQSFGGTNFSNGSGRHGAEKVRGDSDEGFDGGGGGGEIGEGVGGGDGEDWATGAEGGFDAGVGVLDDQAVGGRESEFFGGEEKNVGRGFSIHDIVAADDGVEILIETGG